MRVIFIRHGEVSGMTPPHFRGLIDLSLTPVGQLHAAMVAARIANIGHISTIYTSPLRRCRETATPIGVAIGVTPTIAPAFTDIDFR